MATFYPLTVGDVRRETRDAVVVSLRVADEQKEVFRFKPGQYLTFRTELEGEEVRRSYSLCSALQEPEMRVGIKKVQGGLFSTWANEMLKPGQVIEAMPPMGNFYVPLSLDNQKHYVAFAGGSGITPVLGILKSTLYGEPHSRFTLFYGNEASSTIMFREELEDLKNSYMSRFSLVHILNREHQEAQLLNGRIDKEKCAVLFKHYLDLSEVATAFICGPQAMMLQIAESLQEHGLSKQQIKFELFSSPGSNSRERKVDTTPQHHQHEVCEATVNIDGRSRVFTMAKKTETILDAGLEEGLELPYACKAGVCSTCRAMLLDGEVDMDANFALEDYEIARGYILTCQSYPATDKVVVDFDK